MQDMLLTLVATSTNALMDTNKNRRQFDLSNVMIWVRYNTDRWPLGLYGYRKYPFLHQGGLFGLKQIPLFWISSLASYFPFKSPAIEIPIPLGFLRTFFGVGMDIFWIHTEAGLEKSAVQQGSKLRPIRSPMQLAFSLWRLKFAFSRHFGNLDFASFWSTIKH